MKKQLFILISVSLLTLSCEDKLSETEQFTQYVNEWVYDNMSLLYYWNTTLPAYKSSIADPNTYFKSLKNKDDRFSSIFESYTTISNELNGISASEAGFEFQLYKESATNDNVMGIVLYVKKGTPAASLGVKRGDIFRKLNDKQMTMTNYKEIINYLYDSSLSVNITFSVLQNNIFTDNTPLTINKVTYFKENPIFLDTIYTIQNKKIGYLVYHFFTNDAGDKTMQYDLALNDAFGRFKSGNISELIVDLRYNHGGAMSSAIHLSSMMVPNLTTDKVFSYTEFNKNYTDYFNSDEFKKENTENPFIDNFATSINLPAPKTDKFPVQNVGNSLQKIYFLTGSGTASASEMVINGLKPFLPCVLIGDTTVGKNVGSTLVNDTKNTKNEWAILPIILRYFNKDHKSDFTNGFAPDFVIKDDYSYQLGDTREALLAKAISQITGIQSIPSQKAMTLNTKFNSAIDLNKHRNDLIVNKSAINLYLLSKKNSVK